MWKRSSLCGLGLVSCSILFGAAATRAQEPDKTIRSLSVVDLSFDEPSGNAADSATAGAVKDAGLLTGGARRVSSPFWNQKGKQAVLLDGSRKQFVQLADGADVDRGNGATISLFFLCLVPQSDAAYHGLFAKRAADAQKSVTNYGINFQVKGDKFQVYVHDGSGLRGGVYSVAKVIPYRRSVFLTITYAVADAPAPDADTDKDDVRIRVYANGQVVAPTDQLGGAVTGNDVWLTDVNLAGLLNDSPLTLGSSTATQEFSSGLIDEFSLFDRPLSDEEAAKLFVEVAGDNAVELAKAPAKRAPVPPTIASLSLQGLQSGQTTRLTVSGQNLLPAPELFVAGAPVQVKRLDGATGNRATFEIAVPAHVVPGLYALRLRTAAGGSNALPIALDELPEVTAGASTPENPIALPVAVSGTLSGAAQMREYFRGTAGQHIVVDLVARRIGAKFDPVVELKNERGAPLAIGWGRRQFRGDAREEITIPVDGLYFVEVHDLAYRAPGQSQYRLKIGEMNIVDAVFPPAVNPATKTTFTLIGMGVETATPLVGNLNGLPAGTSARLAIPSVTAPVPAVLLSDSVEIIEAASGEDLQTIDAKFADAKATPVAVNGRLMESGERDRYLLDVTPGQKLRLTVIAGSLGSPLDGQLAILQHPAGNQLAINDDRRGTFDAGLDFTVPAGVNMVQAVVRDLNGRGGKRFLYRLQVARADRPDFNLSVAADRLNVPADGRAVLRINVARAGYHGPIKLSFHGTSPLEITPKQIPAGINSALVTLAAKDAAALSAQKNPVGICRIVGESVKLPHPIRRVARIPANPQLTAVPGSHTTLARAVTSPSGLSLDVAQLPKVLLKGLEGSVAIKLARTAQTAAGGTLRLSLLSTEAVRKIDPKKPEQGNKPRIRALAGQAVSLDANTGTLRIAVPVDVAEPAIDFVLKGEIVENPYSAAVMGTVYSQPFRLPVVSAVNVQLAEKTLTLIGGGQAKLKGSLKRSAPFSGTVEVAVIGLPAGYAAPKVTLPPDQDTFEVVIIAPNVEKPADLANVKLRVTTGPAMLQSDLSLPTKVAPE